MIAGLVTFQNIHTRNPPAARIQDAPARPDNPWKVWRRLIVVTRGGRLG